MGGDVRARRPGRGGTERERLHAEVVRLAADQGGVVSRRQVYALGMTRGEVRAQVRARRWQRVWSRSIGLHTGEVSEVGRWWAAVFEGGDRAVLDGASSLIASGLQGYDCPIIRVSVPRGAQAVRAAGLDVRRTRRWRAADLAPSGVPRTRVAVAAVRGALWAASDRQAALVVTMTVQQGLTTAEHVGRALLDVRRDRRRAMLHALVLDLIGGVRSVGELDFARECRRRGLPEPTRQSLRRGRDGRYYLDAEWADLGLVVEIDGIQHAAAESVVADALRHNEVALEGAVVLRLPLLGWRVARDDFMEQVERGLLSAGWQPAA
jgi:hypothetical protein